MTLKDLEKIATLQILAFIYENKEVNWSALENNINASPGTISSSLEVLGDLGLLEERREPPQKRYISLSHDLGLKIGEYVYKIKKLLEENKD